MIASAQTLRLLKPIHPFEERTTAHGLTFGLGPAGYDIRIAETINNGFWFGPFVLASSIERFNMPDNLLGVVHDKSSWARQGLSVQNTIIEPGWRGHLTLELTNHSDNPLTIKAGMPIAQVVFHFLDEATTEPYDGKYQDQEAGVQKAR